jgi:hypothetical protein
MENFNSNTGRMRIPFIVAFALFFLTSVNAWAVPIATYSIAGNVIGLGNGAGLLPSSVAVGDAYQILVNVDTSFPANPGSSSSFATYFEDAGLFPIVSMSLLLDGFAPIEVFGAPGYVNRVVIQNNSNLGSSFVSQLEFVLNGVQSSGNLADFTFSVSQQTSVPSNFITSAALGAPLGPTPASAGFPANLLLCANSDCSGGAGFTSTLSGSVRSVTLVQVPEPATAFLILIGLAAFALSRTFGSTTVTRANTAN